VNKPTNERFFEELYIEMQSKLLRYAEARISDRADKEYAEDIVEETFKTAWAKLPELMASENPQGWLINALKLHILKAYEKRNKEHPDKREYAETAAETIFDNEISFSGYLSEDEMRIVRLKEAGYKHDEISTIMNVSAGTIHSKVSRIKDKLRKFFGGEKN
jgi:RNA polymerase sigma-70 factor (ECF subfamily)